MIHFGKASGFRSLGSSDINSRQTAWKMSDASSEEKPYFTGMEKISFLYFSISADHACSSPFRQSRTRRTSVHDNRASPRAGSPISIRSAASASLVDIELFHVPQSVRIEDCGPEVSDTISGSHKNIGARKAYHGEFVCYDFLDAVVQLFALQIVERRELLLHQAVHLGFPRRSGLALQIPQMCFSAGEPDVHFR